jgi:Zn finger protein HypA/HybF involved in hydrogenase expression
MGLVVGDLLILTAIVTAGGLVALAISKRKDATLLEQDRLRRLHETERAKREAKLYEDGIPLICIGCETKFVGPLTSSGCPTCHSTTLVVTEQEMNASREKLRDSQISE